MKYTSAQYRKKFFPEQDLNEKPNENVKFVSESFKFEDGKKAPKVSITSTEHHLKAMGHFFELEEKKVNFYINQMKSSGKL